MKKKIFVGQKGSLYEVFRSETTPTRESHGEIYYAVTGPFRTVRGAKAMVHYGYNNPHITNVSEAETVGKTYAQELKDLPLFRNYP